MVHPNSSEKDRQRLLIQADAYLKEAKKWRGLDKFQPSIEAGKKAAVLYQDLEVWDKCLETRHIMAGNLLDTSTDASKIFNYLDETHRIVLQHFGENHSQVVKIFHLYGSAYSRFDDFETALKYHFKELEARKILEGKESVSIAHLYTRIGNNLWEQSLHQQGIEYLEKGLAVLENVSKKFRLGQKKNTTEWEIEKHKALIYISYGGALFRMFFYEKALFYLNQALDIYQKAGKSESMSIGRVYYRLGEIYVFMGEYESALLFFKKLLYLSSSLLKENNPKILEVKHRLAGLLITLELYDEALQYIGEVIDVANNSIVAVNVQPLVETHLHLSQIDIKKKDYEAALRNAKKAHGLSIQFFGEKDPDTGKIESVIGNIYTLKKEYEESLKYFRQSLDIFSALDFAYFMETTRCLCSIGKVLNYQNKQKEALDSIQRALEVSCSNFQESDIYKNPKIEDIPFDTNILAALGLKAAVFFNHYQKNTQDIRDYEAALSNYQLVDKLVGRLRRSYHSTKAQLGLSDRVATENYSKGIYTALNAPSPMDQTALAFTFSEKAKASVLYASLQESIAKASASIPAELLQKEKDLKIKLAYFDKNIQQQKAKGAEKEDETLQKLQNDFFQLHQDYTQLIEGFEQNYPDYYQLKYEIQTLSVEDIQASLLDNQSMVSYFIGESHYYIFFISKGIFEVLEYEKPAHFEEMVQGFLQSIQKHELGVYAQKGYELYQYLLQPIEMYLIDPLADFSSMGEDGKEVADNVPQLIVIPHDILHYVPFEALVCTRTGKRYSVDVQEKDKNKLYQSLDYLLLHCEVTYHYSATLWHYFLTKKGERAQPEDIFVGFAPIYESKNMESSETLTSAAHEVGKWATRSQALRSDGTWTPLPYSKIEAEKAADLFEEKGFSTQVFLNEQATKEQFKEAVEESRFLLVAAHGVVNDVYPKLSGLVFYPKTRESRITNIEHPITCPETSGSNNEQRMTNHQSLTTNHQNDCILSMEEIYPLNLQADLVVLSSCESGVGQLANGEGMMAVNRGFLYAGAKNVVSTLFKVYDQPSSLLTQYLFEEALKGKEYGAALRAAKLKLLRMDEVDVKSWSGFVLIGVG